jgi:hypothetical protein
MRVEQRLQRETLNDLVQAVPIAAEKPERKSSTQRTV